MEQAVTTGVSAEWADFSSSLTYERLPSETVPLLKGVILDTIGTMLAGTTLGDCCEPVVEVFQSAGGTQETTVIGHGFRLPALTAAFANGATAHALNYDSGGAGHIGVAAVPSPLGVAERIGAVSGKELLTAVAVAAEVTARLALSLSVAGVDANEKFLEGQLLSYFGAAAGAGRVLRLSPEQMHNCLGLALMQAAGTRQVSFEGGAAKAIYGAYGNMGGTLAALMAAKGIDARCDFLEGPAGVFSLFYGGKHDHGVLHDGLGERFALMSTRFKPWPTSGVLHPFIEASIQLHDRHHLQPDAVERIHVRASPRAKMWLEPAEERRRPHNAATAANSIFFGVTKGLVNGAVGLGDVTPEGLKQPEALRLAALVTYSLDEAVRSGGTVEVTTRTGQTFTSTVDSPMGSGSRQMTYEQLVTKFKDCARYAARQPSNRAVEEVIGLVDRLEAVPDVAVIPARLSGR